MRCRHRQGTLAAVLLLCAAVAPATGAEIPAAAPSGVVAPAGNEPVHIQADSGIEWQQNAQVYIARGNAIASRGDNSVHADRLIAHYRQVKRGAAGAASGTAGAIGGNTEIYRVEAEGHVVLKRGGQTVVGDRAVYDIDQGVAVITGKGLKLTTATDTVTARDSLEWYDQKQIAVARGDAVATRGDRAVRADILTAYMVKTGPGEAKTKPRPRPGPAIKASAAGNGAEGSKISRIDAQGHVVISRGRDVGRADFGVYNAETGIATLIRNVVIERGKDVIRGDRGVMDLNRNVSRILPGVHRRVQGLFVRDKDGSAPGATDNGGRPAAPPHKGK